MIGFVGALLSALLIWIHTDIKALRTEMNSRFDAVDRRFDAVDRRFESVDRRFEGVDHKLEALNTTVAENGQRLARIETVLSVPVSPPEQASTEPAVAS